MIPGFHSEKWRLQIFLIKNPGRFRLNKGMSVSRKKLDPSRLSTTIPALIFWHFLVQVQIALSKTTIDTYYEKIGKRVGSWLSERLKKLGNVKKCQIWVESSLQTPNVDKSRQKSTQNEISNFCGPVRLRRISLPCAKYFVRDWSSVHTFDNRCTSEHFSFRQYRCLWTLLIHLLLNTGLFPMQNSSFCRDYATTRPWAAHPLVVKTVDIEEKLNSFKFQSWSLIHLVKHLPKQPLRVVLKGKSFLILPAKE